MWVKIFFSKYFKKSIDRFKTDDYNSLVSWAVTYPPDATGDKENKMKKAEKIFKDTRNACRESTEFWGKEYNPDGRPVGFIRLTYGDDEFVCMRTCNEIQKMIRDAKKISEWDLRFGVISQEKYDDEMYILDKIQVTLENQIKALTA